MIKFLYFEIEWFYFLTVIFHLFFILLGGCLQFGLKTVDSFLAALFGHIEHFILHLKQSFEGLYLVG